MAGDWREQQAESRTYGQQLADNLTRGVGSWGFIGAESLLVVGWIALNLVGWARHWDPYPFILLNLVFSVLAAYTAPIVMMSQNRQDERDRDRALADYRIGAESHAEIELVQAALTRIEEEQLPRITALLEELSADSRKER